MTIAINDSGDVLSDATGAWKPAMRAINDKTGESLVLDGSAWKPLPMSKAADPKFDTAIDPSNAAYSQDAEAGTATSMPAGNAAVSRIGHSAAKAFEDTPEFLTPAAREALDKQGGTGDFANRIAHGATNVIGGAHAGMAALSQLAMEVFGEKGGRDALALLSSIPVAETSQLGAMRAAGPEAQVAAAPPSSPHFASERYAPDVSGLAPGDAAQKLIAHDITENPVIPGRAADFGTANQSLAKIGSATNVDEAITAAGDAVKAPAERPMAQWMQPIARDATVSGEALTGEILPPEPGTAPQSMADYLKANSKDVAPTGEALPSVQTITDSINTGDVVNTSKAAKQIGSAYYKIVDAAGDQLPGEVTNKAIDYGRKLAEEDPFVTAARGSPHPIADMMDRLEDYRDKPMSLQAQQGFDQLLGDKINSQFSPKGGLSSEGRELLDLQTHIRGLVQDEIDNPSGAGLPGFEAKIAANKAWSAAMKLDDLERIQERANGTDNPASSIKTQINALLNNKARLRGYTDAEITALKIARDRGALAGALNIIGSRLVPIALGTHGALTLNPVTLAASGAAMGASALARRAVVGIANSRLQNAKNVIGSSVPAQPAP